MQMLLTFIGSHLLTILENLLVQNEPEIVSQVQKEAQLLVSKIESLLKAKAPQAAVILTPSINAMNTLVQDSASSVGNVIVKDLALGS